jgi:hypothetical protein
VFSALTDASGRLDPKVLVSYALPALVATFSGVGILALLIGPPLLDAWVNDLDAVDQIMFVALLLGITTILALFFKAMRRPILHLFGGDILPGSVADWAIRREQLAAIPDRAIHRARPAEIPDQQIDQTPGDLEIDASLRRWMSLIDRAVPLQPEHTKPTRFGNMLANLEDHTYVTHGMDFRLWWPRLAPLLPETMRDIAATESANMTGLLNLTLVWATVGIVGALVLRLIDLRWGTALAILVAGLLLSWISYRAAIREGAEASRHYHAAFFLYRHEILKQMGLEIPADAETERALWKRLTAEMLQRVVPAPDPGATPNGSATATKGGSTPIQTVGLAMGKQGPIER